jgi:hypothetical protein
MKDEIWKEFFKDSQTERAMNSSEVWKNYASSELKRDQLKREAQLERKLDEENAMYEQIEIFRKAVDSSPQLKEYFRKAAKALEANPELVSKVDPNFIRGLSLLDFEE